MIKRATTGIRRGEKLRKREMKDYAPTKEVGVTFQERISNIKNFCEKRHYVFKGILVSGTTANYTDTKANQQDLVEGYCSEHNQTFRMEVRFFMYKGPKDLNYPLCCKTPENTVHSSMSRFMQDCSYFIKRDGLTLLGEFPREKGDIVHYIDEYGIEHHIAGQLFTYERRYTKEEYFTRQIRRKENGIILHSSATITTFKVYARQYSRGIIFTRTGNFGVNTRIHHLYGVGEFPYLDMTFLNIVFLDKDFHDCFHKWTGPVTTLLRLKEFIYLIMSFNPDIPERTPLSLHNPNPLFRNKEEYEKREKLLVKMYYLYSVNNFKVLKALLAYLQKIAPSLTTMIDKEASRVYRIREMIRLEKSQSSFGVLDIVKCAPEPLTVSLTELISTFDTGFIELLMDSEDSEVNFTLDERFKRLQNNSELKTNADYLFAWKVLLQKLHRQLSFILKEDL